MKKVFFNQIAMILMVLSLFSSAAVAQEDKWSLEKPKSLGWYEVQHKCINFEKKEKKNYFIVLYYGTNSKGEHKYLEAYSPLLDVGSTELDIKLEGQRVRIYNSNHTYLVAGTGHKDSNDQPFFPESMLLDSVVEKKDLSIKGGAGDLKGDFSVKVTFSDENKIDTETKYPHNDGGNWNIKRSMKKPTQENPFLIIWYEKFVATHTSSKSGECVQEYVSKFMDPKKTPQPKIIR